IAFIRDTGLSRLLMTIAVLVLAWSLSSIGYFWLQPLLSVDIGYNDAPVFYAIYYAIWAALVFLVFRSSFGQGTKFDEPAAYALYFAAMALCFAGFALLVLPRLPDTEWLRSETPVEFFWANSWYFLPKSFEILFQQILIAALILALNAMSLSLLRISVLVAALFGGFHLTLALSYPNPVYVLRYSVTATLFGAIVPDFILRVRKGFFISYAVHWGFYAVDIVLIHFYFAAD
ncbi:MAG TPA: hypothetical protein VLA45_12575, partial [Paracoccaceae bacterium]|nr:hypothetical protein [Paracoccaceae bacterium]